MEQAINDILFLAKRFQGIKDLIPVLEKTRDLDNAIKEKENILEGLKLKHEELDAAIDNLAVVFEQNQLNAEAVVDEAKKKAKGLINEASLAAADIKKKATQEAEATQQYAKNSLSDIEEDITEAKRYLDQVKDEITKKLKEKDSLEAAIEALKAKFK